MAQVRRRLEAGQDRTGGSRSEVRPAVRRWEPRDAERVTGLLAQPRSWRRLLLNRNLALLTFAYFTLGYFEYIFFYWIYYYFGEVRHADRARLQLMKIMSEFREGMWAVVQRAISTLTNIDFVAYADEHLEGGLRRATAANFERLCAEASS